MIVTIHQPNFLPYLGFFDKILKSDIFIIYDTAQYVKGNFMNRNKINNNGNELYITLSVKKDSWKKPIKDVILNNNDKNYIKIFKTLDLLYKNSPFYSKIIPIIINTFEIYKKTNTLIDGNVYFIEKILKLFNWKGKIYYSSKLNITSIDPTQKLIDMIKKVNASIYLSGVSGKKYLNLDLFKKNNIQIIFQNFKHPIYNTNSNKFKKYLSVIDYIFNNSNKKDIFNNNQTIYNKDNIVDIFYNYNNDELMPIEQATFKSLMHLLHNFDMLDIGIGCGRTTKFFINKVKSYTGIDYSLEMIKQAQIKFPSNQNDLKVVDARSMYFIQDNTYDIVLFSFNGIDYVSQDDRIKILNEIYRVTKKNGYFILSSHNILSNEENVKHLENSDRYDYFITKDKHNLDTYYIKPSKFVKQLKDIGFDTKNIYGYQGEEYNDFENIPKTNHWPYYLTIKI